jgi:hypothetical protein
VKLTTPSQPEPTLKPAAAPKQGKASASRKVFRLANYVCHRTDLPTEGGGTAILVRRGIDHYAIPVPGLTQLEATAIHVG